MGVAREVGQDLFGSGKRPLGIDDPLLASGLAQELGECLGLDQGAELAVELELLLSLELLQARAELAAKDRGERTDGKEVLS